MAAAPSVDLVALASRSIEKATETCAQLDIPRPYGSYEELLADPDIEAVYLPLANNVHTEWSIKAMEAGKHVLCEKPLALSVTEIRLLQEVRDRTGQHIEEAFVFRNHPQWARVAELLTNGTIGEPRGVHVTMAMQFLDPDDIRNNPLLGGGALYDLGSYAISACSMVFGRQPLRVLGVLDRDPVMGIDRLSTAVMDYGGAHAAITVATQSGPAGVGTHQALTVLGSTGWLRLDYPLAQAQPRECHVFVGDESSFGSFPTETFTFPPVNAYTLQADRFSQFLIGRNVPSWPIETALSTVSIIEALFRSQTSGEWQPLT